MIRYLFVSDDPESQQRFAALLDGDAEAEVVSVAWDAFERALNRGRLSGPEAPDVIVLGPGREAAAAIAAGQRLGEARPDASIVLVARPAADLLRDALRAGIRDVLPLDVSTGDAREVLVRAGQAVAHHRAYATQQAEHTRPPGRVITVLSPKGGSGKTVVATNLALALGAAAPRNVAIVDADLQFGAVAHALGVDPTHSIADVTGDADGVDPDSVVRALAAHPAKVAVLAAPASLEEGDQVPESLLAPIVEHLAGRFRFVVVDTPAGLSEGTLAVLEHSTDAILVASMDVPSVRQLRKELDALDAVGLTPQVHLVLNRADSRVGLDPKEVEAVVGMAASAALPSTRLIPLSLNQGRPVVASQPRSRVARELLGLAGRFAEVPAPAKPQRRWNWSST